MGRFSVGDNCKKRGINTRLDHFLQHVVKFIVNFAWARFSKQQTRFRNEVDDHALAVGSDKQQQAYCTTERSDVATTEKSVVGRTNA